MNIREVIDGDFDDCQKALKDLFNDLKFRDQVNLSGVNSINWARLMAQVVYYFWAYLQIDEKEINFIVPSGNFGDMMGGVFAKFMGLPVEKFIISTNSNDEFPVYLKTGKYKTIVPSVNCISSAMNVGHPSNIARLITLYGGKMDEKGKKKD